MARKKFPKNAAKPEVGRAAIAEPVAKEPAEILPFVKAEVKAEAPAGMSNLAARLAKIRLGRQLLATR